MMDMKTYQAVTMAEALAEVKRELGRNAVILRTRRLRKGGILGWIGGRGMWEIQAVPHMSVLDRGPEGTYVAASASSSERGAPDWSDSVPGPETSPRTAHGGAMLIATDEHDVQPVPQTHMSARMNDIHRMVAKLLSRQPRQSADDLPPELSLLQKQLLSQDVDEALVTQLLEQLRPAVADRGALQEGALQARLTELIAGRIGVVDRSGVQGGRPSVIVLIGPTGVGKTTTIAKMAANYKLREKKKVGLLTIDTYRIAAVDQLRTYAEILGVPIEAVLTPGELHGAIGKMSEMDVVLIDTAGRSQNDEMRLKDLRRFIAAIQCDEVHLVISAAANPKVAASALKRFGPLGTNRIIMTKLDEATTFGVILNIAAATDAAVSCVTTGQEVPDDIHPADANLLAECIVKGRWDAT